MPALSYIVSMGIYMLLLFLFLDATREKPKFYKWFFILALFSAPLWFMNDLSWFRWAKVLSVLIPLCFVSFVRMSNDGRGVNVIQSLKKKWPLWVLYFILMLNIVEATLSDFEMGNYFNAACGVILCITIPLPTKHWRISSFDGKHRFGELIADLPLAWCILYTTWNVTFVYAENTGFVASSICILTIPFVWMLFRKRTDLWLMGRMYTLGLHILIRSSYDIFSPVMDSSSWWNADVAYYLGLANLIGHVIYLVYWFFKIRNKDYYLSHGIDNPSYQRKLEVSYE